MPELHFFGVPLHRRSVLLLLGDLVVLAGAVFVGHFLRWSDSGDVRTLGEILQQTTGASVFFVSSIVTSLYVFDCYSPKLDVRKPAGLLRIGVALGAAGILLMALYYLMPRWRWFRGETILSLAVLVLAFLVWRAAASAFHRTRLGPSRVLVLGTCTGAESIGRVLNEPDEFGHGYELVGFVSDEASEVDTEQGSVLGSSSDILDLVRKHGVREVIVASRRDLSAGMTQALLELKQLGLAITDYPTAYRRLTGKVPVSDLNEVWVIFGPDFRGVKPLWKGTLRLADLAIAFFGLVLSVPIVLLAAIAVKLSSRGPAFFVQERSGLNERPFNLIKLRTMKDDAEARTGPVWSQGDSDTRVTPIGRFLRRSRIDEIPQLWNVVRGEMSIVGPRPERPVFVRQLKKSIPYYSLRFAVRPGVTGWAQVRYRYGASEEDAVEKLQYDLYAIQEMSPVLYFLILLKTVQTVLSRPGS